MYNSAAVSQSELAGPITSARPWLGTICSITIGGAVAPSRAACLIETGFAALSQVHRLMSFHDRDSDVARLNRDACTCAVSVSPLTSAVLRNAVAMSELSDGCFDITIAPQLVASGLLPRPVSPHDPDPRACWRDIELLDGDRVRFHRPLWIDLGGIAKGRAVDHALECMRLEPGVQVCINAGGDLRVAGPDAQAVVLRTGSAHVQAPVLSLQDGSVASSSGRNATAHSGGRHASAHVHGVRRAAMGLRSFVCVAAQECMVADALTKVVLARSAQADPILRRLGALAYLHDARGKWHRLGE